MPCLDSRLPYTCWMYCDKFLKCSTHCLWCPLSFCRQSISSAGYHHVVNLTLCTHDTESVAGSLSQMITGDWYRLQSLIILKPVDNPSMGLLIGASFHRCTGWNCPTWISAVLPSACWLKGIGHSCSILTSAAML